MRLEITMNTKERILEVSLQLFAKKGFAGVTVRDIAHEVGVRESALYKHYKSKQEILDNIITVMRKRISEVYVENQVPEKMTENVVQGYEELSEKQLYQIAWNLFSLFTKDPMASSYRKLLMREQFVNEQASELYENTFLFGVLKSQGEVFGKLADGGYFKKEQKEIIALQFYGPIFLLFQQYDCHPDSEEIIKQYLIEHIRVFGKNFMNKA